MEDSIEMGILRGIMEEEDEKLKEEWEKNFREFFEREEEICKEEERKELELVLRCKGIKEGDVSREKWELIQDLRRRYRNRQKMKSLDRLFKYRI